METAETTLLNGRVSLNQPEKGGLRATMDSVFAASACPAKPGDRVCDLGAGTGAVGLCVAARVTGIALTFVELQRDFADLALRNAGANHVNAQSECADIRDYRAQKPFDHIVMNPPYLDAGTYTQTPDDARGKALGEVDDGASLEDWVTCASLNVKNGGTLSLIHRADHLDDILILLRKKHFGAIEIWPLQAYAESDAHRVVVRAIKARKTRMILHPGIVLHTGGAEKHSDAAKRILLDMGAI